MPQPLNLNSLLQQGPGSGLYMDNNVHQNPPQNGIDYPTMDGKSSLGFHTMEVDSNMQERLLKMHMLAMQLKQAMPHLPDHIIGQKVQAMMEWEDMKNSSVIKPQGLRM